MIKKIYKLYKQSKKENWKQALLTLRLDKFIGTNLSKNKILVLLKNLDSDKLKIIEFIKPNIVIFKKRNCPYEFVGKDFEKWLFKHFKLKKKVIKNENTRHKEKSKKIRS